MFQRDCRNSGIDAVGDVSWGTHFCQFYETRQDLLDILIPYLKSGLENNEFCLWITAEPLPEKAALRAMKRAVPDLATYFTKGQIEILPYDVWYLRDGTFDMQRVLNAWEGKIQQALANGYQGIRVTGNTSWLKAANWQEFTEYEAAINDSIGSSRMLALCSYWLKRCGAGKVLDVVRNHGFTLIKNRGTWELIESAVHRKARESLLESERAYQRLWENLQEGIWVIDADGRTILVNESMARMLGYPPEEMVGESLFSFMSHESVAMATRNMDRRRHGVKERHEFEFERVDGSPLHVIMEASPLFDAHGRYEGAIAGVIDISDLKSYQEALRFERDKLDGIMKAMDDGVYIVNRDYDIEYANPSLIRQFGPFERKKCYRYLHDRGKPCPWCKIDEVFRGRSIRWEWFSPKNERFYDLLDTPLRKPDGSVCKLEIFRDITERKITEEALRESEEKYRTIVETASEGIVVTDSKGKISFANSRMAETLGYEPEEMVGTSAFDLVDPGELAQMRKRWRNRKKGLSDRYETRVKRKDGSTFWMLISTAPIFDKAGRFSGVLAMSTDISDLKRVEQELRESQKWLRTLFESSLIGIFVADMEGRIYEANDAFLDILGYSLEDLETGGLDWSTVTPFEYALKDDQALAELLESGFCSTYEKKYQRKDGGTVSVLIGGALLGVVEDAPRWVCFVLDVSGRKKVEEALAREREMLRTIMENTDAQLTYLDTDFNIVMVNSSFVRGSGHSFEELISRNYFDLFPDVENQAIFEQVRDSGEWARFHDKPYTYADQPQRGVTYWDWTLAPVKDSSGEVHGLVLSLVDTTEGVRVRQELRRHREELEALVEERTAQLKESYDRVREEIGERQRAEEKLRALSNRLVQLQEEERRTIARELHDEIGQSLTVLKLFLDKCHASGSDDDFGADLNQARELVKGIMGQVRSISLTLRPTMLDDLGLLPTLQWHFERYTAQTHIHVNFRHAGLQKMIPREVCTAAYRIVQEALTNVARHAGTGEVMVCIRSERGVLLVEIEDHGVGFDIDKVGHLSSIGLSGMTERVLALDGSLTIESTPGNGTYLLAELPIPDGSRGIRRQKQRQA